MFYENKENQGYNINWQTSTKVSREKYWSELTSDEKIERMRGIVQRLERQLIDVQNDYYVLSKHQHKTDGQLMIPFESHSIRDSPTKVSPRFDRPGEEYF